MNPPNHRVCPVRVGSLTSIIDSLLSSAPELVRDFAQHGTMEHGVYAISDPTDSEVVYVGRTTTAKEGLRQRLWDHLNNNQSSDLNQKLGGNRLLAGEHLVRIIPIPVPDDRRLAEVFGIGALNPKLNK